MGFPSDVQPTRSSEFPSLLVADSTLIDYLPACLEAFGKFRPLHCIHSGSRQLHIIQQVCG